MFSQIMQIIVLGLFAAIVASSFVLYLFLSSRRKQDELTARMADALFAFDHALSGIARVNLDGVFVSVNRKFAESAGSTQELLLKRDWRSFIHPMSLENVESGYSRMLLGGPVNLQVQCLRPDQVVWDAELLLTPAQDRSNRIIGHYCFTLDITTQKELERTIEALQSTLVESACIDEELANRRVSR